MIISNTTNRKLVESDKIVETKFNGRQFPNQPVPKQDEDKLGWISRLVNNNKYTIKSFLEEEDKLSLITANKNPNPYISKMIYYNEVSPTILKLINKRQKQIDVVTYFASVIPYQIKSKLHLKNIVAKISRVYQKFLSKGLENYKYRSFHVAKFCNYCFETDDEPYVREVWRHPASICCSKHNVLLSLMCSNCKKPFQYWRSKKVNSCYHCNFELSNSESLFLSNKFLFQLHKSQDKIIRYLDDYSNKLEMQEKYAILHLYYEYLYFTKERNGSHSPGYLSLNQMNEDVFIQNTLKIGKVLPNGIWVDKKFTQIQFEGCISTVFSEYLIELFHTSKKYLIMLYTGHEHHIELNTLEKRFAARMKYHSNIIECYFQVFGWYGDMAIEYAKYRLKSFEKEFGKIPKREDFASLATIMSRRNWKNKYKISFHELMFKVFGVSNLLINHQLWESTLQYEWDHERNKKPPKSYTYGTLKKVYWICQLFNHKWDAAISSRTKGIGCPMCSGFLLSDQNRLTSSDEWKKYLKSEWHEDNTLNPHELSTGSHDKVDWRCSDCKYVWPSIIKHRVKGHGCPKCAGNIVSEKNGLVFHTRWEKILKDEWDYEDNEKSPEKYSYGATYYANWICKKCSNKWPAQISKRTSLERNCPECGKIRVKEYNRIRSNVNDKNRLTNHWSWQYLKHDWDYERNKKPPEEYARGSNKKTHWKCQKCDYRWEIRIYTRTSGSKCKRCKYEWNKEIESRL